jgi:type IX secretion system PorP/SprF family membrane protein
MRIIKSLLIFSVIFLTLTHTYKAEAQQDQLFLVYPFMPLVVNPAYAGSNDVVNITGVFRKRPLFNVGGVSGATQQFISIDTPIAQDKMGIGFQAFNGNQAFANAGGVAGNLGFYGDFAYKISMPHDGRLSLGAQLGVTQVPVFFQSGGIGSGGGSSSSTFKESIGLGVYYRTDDLYAGVSYQNLTAASDSYAKPIFFTAGYLYEINSDLKIRVGTLGRYYTNSYVTDKLALDFNTTLWIKDRFGFGVWYMNTGSEFSSKSLLASAEFQLGDQFRFGYSYDFKGKDPISTSLGYNDLGGFHQLMIRYEFDSGNGKIGVPRFF